MLGLEVEGVQRLGGEFEGVVVAQVLAKDKVAGSDKLSVNRVHDGTGERTIICGAPNHQPGDKVALILPNFALPLKPGEKEPFVIKERKVFGVVSQGMMCSKKELGLGEDSDGIIILPPDAKVGQSFAEHLGRAGSDVVYDLEVTPNRPDLNSVIGIAREIAALTGNPLRIPEVSSQNSEARIQDLVAVRLDESELCPRYTARVVTGVKVGPSPDWLRQTLEKVGIRSISNVVDVTNYVMLEIDAPGNVVAELERQAANIGDIVDECNVGEYVMHSSTINHEVLNGKQAAEELFNAGSEPQFFRIDDEGNEID